MPTMRLDNVPDDLYQRIAQLADADRLSLPEEALLLLRKAIHFKSPDAAEKPARSQQEVLEEIGRQRFPAKPGMPSVVDMLREDRQR